MFYLLLAFIPLNAPTTVYTVELNHLHRTEEVQAGFKRELRTKHVMDQLIFYRKHHRLGEVVAQWELVPEGANVRYKNGILTAGHRKFKVMGGFLETWTDKDPERENRKIWSDSRRTKFFNYKIWP